MPLPVEENFAVKDMMTFENWIKGLSSDFKRITPFQREWLLPERYMILLLDAGIIGMDGFQWQFVEYARDCWNRCHRGQ